jgi:hypothetical protein
MERLDDEQVVVVVDNDVVDEAVVDMVGNLLS